MGDNRKVIVIGMHPDNSAYNRAVLDILRSKVECDVVMMTDGFNELQKKAIDTAERIQDFAIQLVKHIELPDYRKDFSKTKFDPKRHTYESGSRFIR